MSTFPLIYVSPIYNTIQQCLTNDLMKDNLHYISNGNYFYDYEEEQKYDKYTIYSIIMDVSNANETSTTINHNIYPFYLMQLEKQITTINGNKILIHTGKIFLENNSINPVNGRYNSILNIYNDYNIYSSFYPYIQDKKSFIFDTVYGSTVIKFQSEQLFDILLTLINKIILKNKTEIIDPLIIKENVFNIPNIYDTIKNMFFKNLVFKEILRDPIYNNIYINLTNDNILQLNTNIKEIITYIKNYYSDIEDIILVDKILSFKDTSSYIAVPYCIKLKDKDYINIDHQTVNIYFKTFVDNIKFNNQCNLLFNNSDPNNKCSTTDFMFELIYTLLSMINFNYPLYIFDASEFNDSGKKNIMPNGCIKELGSCINFNYRSILLYAITHEKPSFYHKYGFENDYTNLEIPNNYGQNKIIKRLFVKCTNIYHKIFDNAQQNHHYSNNYRIYNIIITSFTRTSDYYNNINYYDIRNDFHTNLMFICDTANHNNVIIDYMNYKQKHEYILNLIQLYYILYHINNCINNQDIFNKQTYSKQDLSNIYNMIIKSNLLFNKNLNSRYENEIICEQNPINSRSEISYDCKIYNDFVSELDDIGIVEYIQQGYASCQISNITTQRPRPQITNCINYFNFDIINTKYIEELIDKWKDITNTSDIITINDDNGISHNFIKNDIFHILELFNNFKYGIEDNGYLPMTIDGGNFSLKSKYTYYLNKYTIKNEKYLF